MKIANDITILNTLTSDLMHPWNVVFSGYTKLHSVAHGISEYYMRKFIGYSFRVLKFILEDRYGKISCFKFSRCIKTIFKEKSIFKIESKYNAPAELYLYVRSNKKINKILNLDENTGSIEFRINVESDKSIGCDFYNVKYSFNTWVSDIKKEFPEYDENIKWDKDMWFC